MKKKSTHEELATDSYTILPRWVVMEVKPQIHDLNGEVRHCNDGVTLEQHELRRDKEMKIQDFNQEYESTKVNNNSIMSTVIGENAVIRSSVCFTDGLREPIQDRHKGVTTFSEAEPFDLPSLERDLVDPQSYYYPVKLQLTNLLADLECVSLDNNSRTLMEKGVINQDTDEMRTSMEAFLLTDGVLQTETTDDVNEYDRMYGKVPVTALFTSGRLYNRKPNATHTTVGGTGREYQYGRRSVIRRGVVTDERSR